MSWKNIVALNTTQAWDTVWDTLQDIHLPSVVHLQLPSEIPDIQLPRGIYMPDISDAMQMWKDFQFPELIQFPVSFIIVPFILSLPVACYIFYQLFLHPLARYPGPFWGRVTGLRAAYHAWIGDVHVDMWRLHEKYGPYVRYSPNYLLCNTTEAFKDIYSRNKNVQKSRPYLAMVHNTPSTFTVLDAHEHAWKKRILSQKLSDSTVRSFGPKIAEIVDRFIESLCPGSLDMTRHGPVSAADEISWSKPFDMSRVCDNLFFDLVTMIVFGESFDLIRRPWYRHIPTALARSNVRMSVIVQFPYVVYRRLDKLLFRESVLGRKEFLRFAHHLVSERILRGRQEGDVFSALLDAKDPTTGNSMTQDEIVAESILMLVAGSDTSSTLHATLFFYLAHNPAKKQRLLDEVRGQFASRDAIQLGSKPLLACRYLHACISECLRLAPPVAAAPFREVKEGGLVLDQTHVLPAGVNVGTGLFSMHHNHRYFQDPFSFLPERWLAAAEAKNRLEGDENDHGQNPKTPPVLPHNTEAYAPFSIGSRVCLGKGLALSEASLVMARICWSLDFELVEDMRDVGAGHPTKGYGRHRPGEFQLYDHITVNRDGPMVRFRPRVF